MLAENRQMAKYGYATFTPRGGGSGRPRRASRFQRRRMIRSIVFSGITSRVLNVWAATNRKKVIGNQRKNSAAASAPALPAPLVLDGVGFQKKLAKCDGPSFAVKA